MEKPDIVFTCSKCHQWLESPPDLTGLFVECPKCSEIIKVPEASEDPSAWPAASTSYPASPSEEPDRKASTVRIELPPDLGIPHPPPKKRFILRRPS